MTAPFHKLYSAAATDICTESVFLSVTITKSNGDLPMICFNKAANFLDENTEKYSMAYEKGKRKRQVYRVP